MSRIVSRIVSRRAGGDRRVHLVKTDRPATGPGKYARQLVHRPGFQQPDFTVKDHVTHLVPAREVILSDSTTVDVRVSELADPRPGDLIILGTESFVIQGEPVRDAERLIWALDLRPA